MPYLAAPGVWAAAPRVVTAARLNVGWEEFPVMAIGIDPILDRHALDLVQHVEGRLPQHGEFEAVVGSGLADLLDIGIGDYITLIARTRSGAIEALDFTVAAASPPQSHGQPQPCLPSSRRGRSGLWYERGSDRNHRADGAGPFSGCRGG